MAGRHAVSLRSRTPCSSLIALTVTAGRSKRTPYPGAPEPRTSLESAFEPASTTTCPGTATLMTVPRTV